MLMSPRRAAHLRYRASKVVRPCKGIVQIPFHEDSDPDFIKDARRRHKSEETEFFRKYGTPIGVPYGFSDLLCTFFLHEPVVKSRSIGEGIINGC